MDTQAKLSYYHTKAVISRNWMYFFLFLTVVIVIILTGNVLSEMGKMITLFLFLFCLFNVQWFFLDMHNNIASMRQIRYFESIKKRGMHPKLVLEVMRISARMATAKQLSSKRSFWFLRSR